MNEPLMPTPAVRDTKGPATRKSGCPQLPNVALEAGELLPTPRATDGTKGGPNQRGSSGGLMLPSVAAHLDVAGAGSTLLPTPIAQDAKHGLRLTENCHGQTSSHTWHTVLTAPGAESAVNWGKYAPAIRRWEAVNGPVPSPTAPGRHGKPRLAPQFSEWLMGLPAGHVTAVPGLSRNAQLTAIGNGVVPQQAAYALRHLLPAMLSALENRP